MKALVTCEQSRELDAATRQALALSSIQLMEKASIRLWDALLGYVAGRPALRAKGRDLRIVALCGHGDNGGDALAMLRHAYSAGFRNLMAIVSRREASDASKAQALSLASARVSVRRWRGEGEATRADRVTEARDHAEGGNDEGGQAETSVLDILGSADLVLDGILGTGTRGAASGEAAEMIRAINGARRGAARSGAENVDNAAGTTNRPTIAAIDLPSGLGDAWRDGMPRVEADYTLSLEPAKAICFAPGARSACGELVSVDDVFPETLIRARSSIERLEAGDVSLLAPRVGDSDYKTSRGRLAIFAGSEGALGAAQLCARAAGAGGAGYITLFVDDALYPLAAPALESVIVKPLSGLEGMPVCDAILAGPGWGKSAGRKELLEAILASGIPAILDADALRLLAANPGLASSATAPCALTPHPGEFATLEAAFYGDRPDDSFPRVLGEISRVTGMLTIYKSSLTWIASPEGRLAVWEGLTPELGTAGSGDVLAGLFAGLSALSLARLSRANQAPSPQKSRAAGEALRDAALCAVSAHGLAGKRLARDKGWFGAAELVESCALLLRVASREPNA